MQIKNPITNLWEDEAATETIRFIDIWRETKSNDRKSSGSCNKLLVGNPVAGGNDAGQGQSEPSQCGFRHSAEKRRY